jgi:hypothetical protein
MNTKGRGIIASLCIVLLTSTFAVARADARVVVHEESEHDYVLDHRYNHHHS